MKIPAGPRLVQALPKVDDTDLLMAAAEMHDMGRLIVKDPMYFDALEERTNPDTAGTVEAIEGISKHAPDHEKRRFEVVPKRIEQQFRYNRDHPKRDLGPVSRGRG